MCGNLTEPCVATIQYHAWHLNRTMRGNKTEPCMAIKQNHVWQPNRTMYGNKTEPCVATKQNHAQIWGKYAMVEIEAILMMKSVLFYIDCTRYHQVHP